MENHPPRSPPIHSPQRRTSPPRHMRESQSSFPSQASGKPTRGSIGSRTSRDAPDYKHIRKDSQLTSESATNSVHNPNPRSKIKGSSEAHVQSSSTKPEWSQKAIPPPSTFMGNDGFHAKKPGRDKSSYGCGKFWSSQNSRGDSLSRCPPTTPILLPENRYCFRCKIVKPYRTHHCRICGTVG